MIYCIMNSITQGLLAALKTLNQVSSMNMSQISEGMKGKGNDSKNVDGKKKVIITEDLLLQSLDKNSPKKQLQFSGEDLQNPSNYQVSC